MPDLNPKIILVIDDDPDVCETLALRLESFGYRMTAASNGEDGIQKAKSLNPAAIFLDYAMPGENGYEILKKIKSDPSKQLNQIPVVMLTGQEEYEQQCLENGAAGYLTKPFDLFALKEVLSGIFSK